MYTAEKDPVCGMPVQASTALRLEHDGVTYLFCSQYCRDAFLRHAAAYVRPQSRSLDERPENTRIAYFSMEAAIDSRMPTYSGGLGVLAGDTLKASADLRVPMVAVTLVHRRGYFRQMLDAAGNQSEQEELWSPETCLRPLAPRAVVEIERRPTLIRAWRYDVVGAGGHIVPLLLLDTDLPENSDDARRLTDRLYGGDERYRFAQEMILGIGGVRMLAALGYSGLRKFHLNEGHAALASLELLGVEGGEREPDFARVRQWCVFTTHTPVPAGHDQFDYGLVTRMLDGRVPIEILKMLAGPERLNMTQLALSLSGHVNGVARRHREVTEAMFPGYEIASVTNGVHSLSWTAASFATLYDNFVPGWREDPAMLRTAVGIPDSALALAHREEKTRLLTLVRERTGRPLAPDALTVGFARRATPYKRAHLVLQDTRRLRALAHGGLLQFVFAGKAHPRDQAGKDIIRHIVAIAKELGEEVPLVYLADYNLELARALTAGVDLWLNTPQRPLEASGTSGMKAAHNGVPSLSVLDGWWLEGHIEGVTGWSIGDADPGEDDAAEAEELYNKLAVILHLFHHEPERWLSIMKSCIALNASYFNTHRMVQGYVSQAYMA